MSASPAFDQLTMHALNSLLDKCIHCGLCPPACPTYLVRGTEMEALRGRIAILRALAAGRLPLSWSVSRYIYDCIGCESCQVACPSGVRAGEIIAQAKRIIAKSPYLPGALADLRERVYTHRNISGEPADHRLLWMDNLEQDIVPSANKNSELVLFTGCVSALYPAVYGVLQSIVRILRAMQVDFTLLGSDEWCCGYPLLAAGLDTADLITHNLSRLRALGAKTLLTTCPSCYYMWKYHYAPPSTRVLHASEFLAELAASGRLSFHSLEMQVTYHDPCDLGRKSRIFDAPRQLVQSIPGVHFSEMKANRDNALCCGGGGNLESVDVESSRQIATLRVTQAQEVDAQVIVSACQQCERTLAMASRRAHARIQVMDLAQLVDKALEHPC